MKRTILIALAIAAVGCDQTDRPGQEAPRENPEVRSEPDNTETNTRDQNASALTPGDQGGSEADREITQRVRQGVVGHDDLSMTAENVKIITVDGVVTLRGPVNNAKERSTILAIAKGVEGVKRVDNQLEVSSN